MSTATLEFLLVLLVLGAGFFYLPGRRSRLAVLFALNAAFFYFMVKDPLSIAVLVGFVFTGYACGKLLLVKRSTLILTAYLTLLVAAFVYLRKYQFLELFIDGGILNHPVVTLGLSYMFFRQIHFLVDVNQGQIQKFSLPSYLNYQLNFFALIAGPIQRYQVYDDYWNDPRPLLTTRNDLLQAYLRIFIGVVKVVILGAICLQAFEKLAGRFDVGATGGTWWRAVRILYIYPAYVYFNFSGYCDIVIGGASLIGLQLPENFNQPYLSRSIIDFWTRWHMSLGFWIRDYLFSPMYKAIAQRNAAIAPSFAFVCYFFALFLAGMWHGSTWNFAIFALMHGSAVSINKLWEMFLVKKKGRPWFRQYMASPVVHIAAVVITFHFLCVSFLFVPTDVGRTLRILGALIGLN